MANRNSKTKDPGKLAFSAVENALKDSAFADGAASASKQQAAQSKPRRAAPSERMRTAQKIAMHTNSVANDDRFRNAGLPPIRQGRASFAPLLLAALFAIIWLAIASFSGWARYQSLVADAGPGADLLATPDFVGLIMIAVLPALAIMGMGILVRRSQDLHIAANAMSQAAMRLTEPESTAADKVASVGQAVRREVNALVDGLERARTRAGEFEVMVHNEVTSLERTYSENEARLRALIQDLAEQRDSVKVNAESVREAIAEAHRMMVGDLDHIGDTLSDTITSRGTAVKAAIESAAAGLENTLDGHTSSFVSLVDNRSTDLVTTIEGSTARFNTTLDERISNLSTELDGRAAAISGAIEERTSRLADTLDSGSTAIVANLEERSKAIIASLDERRTEMATTLQDLTTSMVGDISGHTKQAETALSGLTERLDETLSVKVNAIESRFQTALLEIGTLMEDNAENVRQTVSQAGEGALESISTRIQEVSVALDTRLQSMDAVVGEKGERLIAALDGHAEKFAERANLLQSALDEKTGVLNASLDEKTATFTTAIEQKTELLNTSLEGRSEHFATTIDERTKTLGETISQQTHEFSEQIVSRTRQLSSAIGSNAKEFDDTLEQHTKTLTETLTGRTQELARTIDAHAELVETRLHGVMHTVNDNIDTGVDAAILRIKDAETGLTQQVELAANRVSDGTLNAAATIEQGFEAARTEITAMLEQRIGSLPEALTARVEIAADRLTELNTNLNTSIATSMSELEAGADRIEETISLRISTATETIARDVEQTATHMDAAVRGALEQVNDATRHIEDLVEIKAVNSANELGEKVAEMHRTVAAQSDTFARLIEAKSAELDTALRSHGNILREALENATLDSEAAVASSTGRMLDNVNGALEKLNDSNLLLQRVLETTTGNLAELETRIAGQTSTYSDTVREAVGATEQAGQLVGEHVGAFQTAVSAMVEQFSELVESLDMQSANIDKSAHTLQEAGSFSLDKLESRRVAMDALAESFTSRANDIDTRMREFATSIAETVSSTEQRLITARKAMEEALAATSSSVGGQIEAFTATAGAESERTGEVLREAQATMLKDIRAALDEATSRFNATAKDMRATASEVGKELEATRNELQRGVLELPEETRASAAAMRRVVAEQIEALNELNNIVRSQPGTHDLDVHKPWTPPAPRSGEGDGGQKAKANAPTASAQSREMAEASAEPQRPEPSPVKASTAAPAASRGAGASAADWLQDVLRNASASQKADARKANDINNLSAEIARSIDEAALAEAWQHYQQGNQNAFSRRIYTLTGQGTYDDMRKKLQRDSDFAATAKTYLDEFEQLLQAAISGKSPAAETRKLLLSDRGKVYTMLAHASGRLS